MFVFKEIYRAYIECRKRKRNTINVLHYEANLINNLQKNIFIKDDLKSFEIVSYLRDELGLELRDRYILRGNHEGLDFLGYIIRPHYTLVRRRVVHNFKYKKALYLAEYEKQRGKMNLEEIRAFLSVQASFVGHIKHANSFKLQNKVGKIDETNSFDYDRC